MRDARAAAGRALGPLTGARHGNFYAWRRAAMRQMARAVSGGSLPAFDRLDPADLPARVRGARVHQLYPACVEHLPLPRIRSRRGWVASVLPFPSPLALPAVHVMDLPNAVHFGYDGTFGPDEHTLVALPSVNAMSEREEQWLADEARGRRERVRFDGTTLSLLQSVHSNHAHWLLQGLPRLDLVQRVADLDSVDRVLVNEGAPEPVYTALERVGVDLGIVVEVPKSAGVLECERLILSTPVHRYAVLSDWSRAWLASLFEVREPGSIRRLFVGRGNAERRRTVNYQAVQAVLESRGFVTMAMDGRPVDEQAALFAGADVVVAEHGAALANLAFARPGTRVIELCGANTVSWMYGIASGRAGLDYDLLLGTEPTVPRPWWSWQVDADQVVDVERLCQLLDRIDA
jgi:capsular polysaccharide biosynthesis protein